MAKGHGDTQRDKHFDGVSLEEKVVRILETMLEKAGLDAHYEIVGKQRSRRHNVLVLKAPLLPGATRPMELRPDFGIRHKTSGLFAAYGGAKKSFRERSVQDYVIAKRLREIFPDMFWFEATIAEHDDATTDQIKANLKRLASVYGDVWDAICSTSAPETVTEMKVKLTAHLKGWKPPVPRAAE